MKNVKKNAEAMRKERKANLDKRLYVAKMMNSALEDRDYARAQEYAARFIEVQNQLSR